MRSFHPVLPGKIGSSLNSGDSASTSIFVKSIHRTRAKYGFADQSLCHMALDYLRMPLQALHIMARTEFGDSLTQLI
jgi:hypothetical protein